MAGPHPDGLPLPFVDLKTFSVRVVFVVRTLKQVSQKIPLVDTFGDVRVRVLLAVQTFLSVLQLSAADTRS